MHPYFVLYVADQKRSAAFYRQVLGIEPRLDVPGMTEFDLGGGSVLGLMPEAGIQRLLGSALSTPFPSADAARAELYLLLPQAQAHHARALAAGARELSSLQRRNWGHWAAYSLDPDGYVLAFAQSSDPKLPENCST